MSEGDASGATGFAAGRGGGVRLGWDMRAARTRRRAATGAVALAVIVGAAGLAVAVHALLGMLELRIAVARSSAEDRQAATALLQLFSDQHPRLRIAPVLEPDRLGAAAALDRGASDLALLRSDAAAQDGQTLVILRRDAVAFVVPEGSRVDAIPKLRGATVALLDGRRLDQRLLDVILAHHGVPEGSVRREVLGVDRLAEAARHRRIDAVFVVAPPGGKAWLPVYAALRKAGGPPRTVEIDEAAAIAGEHPVYDTIDVPKGTFSGSVPGPGDDVTTLSVSHRLVARGAVPDWLAGEITRAVLNGKPRLAALDPDLAGIEAPDTDDRNQALPIHPGAAAYLSGNLPSLSDQAQNALYWLGLMTSALASLGAAAAALYQRYRPQGPSTRVMRLLEIWPAVRGADAAALDDMEAEADALAAEMIRAEAHERTETVEARLVTLLVAQVREALQRRRGQLRAGAAERA